MKRGLILVGAGSLATFYTLFLGYIVVFNSPPPLGLAVILFVGIGCVFGSMAMRP